MLCYLLCMSRPYKLGYGSCKSGTDSSLWYQREPKNVPMICFQFQVHSKIWLAYVQFKVSFPVWWSTNNDPEQPGKWYGVTNSFERKWSTCWVISRRWWRQVSNFCEPWQVVPLLPQYWARRKWPGEHRDRLGDFVLAYVAQPTFEAVRNTIQNRQSTRLFVAPRKR